MKRYSKNTLPRETPTGRPVYFEEQRRSANRTAMYAIAGLLVLCVCLVIGVVGIGYGGGLLGGSSNPSGLNLPSLSGSTPTIEERATPIPYLKSAKNNTGLRVTVTAYQRPLPFEDVKVPTGQELVLVTVKVENTRTTGAALKYGPEDFKLVSPDQDSFAPDIGMITTGEMLKKGELGPGKSAKGDMVFYVYSDVKNLVLNWNSSDGSTLQFALGRK